MIFAAFIEPIRLPSLSQQANNYDDEVATVSGVGVTST